MGSFDLRRGPRDGHVVSPRLATRFRPRRQLGTPVVETAQGGTRGGGATLTAEGRHLLNAFRRIQHKTARAVERELDEIAKLVRRKSRRRV